MSSEHVDQKSCPTSCCRRLRVGSKTVLVLIALPLCGWFAIRTARHHQANRMIARHNAVLEVIVANLADLPVRCKFIVSPNTRPELDKFLGRTWPNNEVRLDAVLHSGEMPAFTAGTAALDIAELLTEGTDGEAAMELVGHYSRKLADLGLDQIASGGAARSMAIWKSPAGDLDVWITVDTHAEAKTADVRMNFLDGQRLVLW